VEQGFPSGSARSQGGGGGEKLGRGHDSAWGTATSSEGSTTRGGKSSFFPSDLGRIDVEDWGRNASARIKKNKT